MLTADDGLGAAGTLLGWIFSPTGAIVLTALLVTLVTVGGVAAVLTGRAVLRKLSAAANAGHRRITATAAPALPTRHITGHAAGLGAQALSVHAQAQLLPPGPRRQIAGLRHQLHREVDATRACLAGGGADAALPIRLATAARDLDAELRELSREPDGQRLRAGLAAARLRAEDLRTLSAELRDATRARRDALTAPAIEALRGDIADEVTALRAGTERLQDR
jgi:hypothetical protein